ncbi:hypothetical protein APHAL10511_008595 [Amanita phalloides]|nr:hypothetical protein APHAL10511_008595 [Amanita phalloides]
MRGPLTPYAVPDATWMDIHSNTGEDLQIIDTQLGLMDISYSAAWQLGKSLAIADQAFCAALIRIRADVYDKSSEKAKEKELSKKFEDATSKRVIDALPEHFSDMMQLSKQPFDQQRWDRPSLIQSRYQLLAEGKDTESYNEAIAHHLRRRVERLASATDGIHYTEAKDPLSTDWDLVLNWILDKIYLDRVPPWYLIPDPTWLPAESIRFFYVDHKWLSALVDGALSVANHLDKQDKVRQVIKDQLVKYLNEEIHPELKHPPQIPSYGFYLRSVVVDAFPDLVVRAPWPTRDGKPDLRAEVLRQENVRKDIMFCLLDRIPKDLQQLILSQPPHQQCFMFGHDSTFTNSSFDLELRKVYSVHTTKHMDELPKQSFSKGEDGRCEIYDWNTRTILVDKFAGLVSRTLDDAHKQDSEIYDGEANASLLGIELNDPIYRLTFFPPNQPPAALDEHLVAFSLPGEAPYVYMTPESTIANQAEIYYSSPSFHPQQCQPSIPHNINVFSILDNFAYEDNGIKYVKQATANYYVMGWHSDPKDDPFCPPQEASNLLHAARLEGCYMKLTETQSDKADNWLRAPLSEENITKVLIHGALYQVQWDEGAKPSAVPADNIAKDYDKFSPVSVGVNPVDALLAITHARALFNDTLVIKQDEDPDTQLQAADILFTSHFVPADGGQHWHVSGTTGRGKHRQRQSANRTHTTEFGVDV